MLGFLTTVGRSVCGDVLSRPLGMREKCGEDETAKLFPQWTVRGMRKCKFGYIKHLLVSSSFSFGRIQHHNSKTIK